MREQAKPIKDFCDSDRELLSLKPSEVSKLLNSLKSTLDSMWKFCGTE